MMHEDIKHLETIADALKTPPPIKTMNDDPIGQTEEIRSIPVNTAVPILVARPTEKIAGILEGEVVACTAGSPGSLGRLQPHLQIALRDPADP